MTAMTDPLQKLFGSPARVKLLRLFLFNPREQRTVADAAARAQVTSARARAEMALFESIGLIKPTRLGRTGRRGVRRYVLNGEFTYTAALQALLLNAPARLADSATAKGGAELYKRLRSTGTVKLIIAAGVFVGDWDGRLDMLVVGDRINERRLRARVRSLESELGKELRYALLSTPDFFYRLNMSDKLVRDVLDYPHRVVHDKLEIGLK